MKMKSEDFTSKKKRHEPIVMLTCYDYPTAVILDKCEIDILLVGDSVGTNILGYSDIRMVTVEDMIHHIGAVSRGCQRSFILGDLPYVASTSLDKALDASERFLQKGANAIKLEGTEKSTQLLSALVQKNIAVCGHIGFTPQTHQHAMVMGKDSQTAKQLITDALAIQDAGAFMIVLELIPCELAKEITTRLSIPTIGIGAGVHCDGQVQVLNDIAGLSPRVFKHSTQFGQVSSEYTKAVRLYEQEVRKKSFPLSHQSAHLSPPLIAEISSWTSASN
jgi:3-methyl-2-oxobutanoate hydroxymethyltransferase